MAAEHNVLKAVLAQYDNENSSDAVKMTRKEMDALRGQISESQNALRSVSERRTAEALEREATNARYDESIRLLRAEHAQEIHKLTLAKNETAAALANALRDCDVEKVRSSEIRARMTEQVDEIKNLSSKLMNQQTSGEKQADQLRNELSSSRDKISSLQAEIASLKSLLSSAEKTLEAERRRLADEVSAIKSSGKGEIDFIRNESEAAVKRSQLQNDKIAQDLRNEVQKSRDEYARARQDLLDQNTSLRQTLQAEASSLRSDHAAQVATLKDQHLKAIDLLQSDLRRKQSESTAEIANLQADKIKLAQDLSVTSDSLKTLQRSVDSKYAEIDQSYRNLDSRSKMPSSPSLNQSPLSASPQEKFIVLATKYEKTIQDLAAAVDEIARLKQEKDVLSATIEKRHKDELARLSAEYKSGLASHEKTIALLQDKSDSSTKQLLQSKNDLQSQYDSTVKLLQDDASRQRDEHAAQIRSIDDKHRALIASLNTELKQLQAARAQDIKQLTDQKHEIESELIVAKANIQSLSQANKAKHQELLDYQRQYESGISAVQDALRAEKDQAAIQKKSAQSQHAIELDNLKAMLSKASEDAQRSSGEAQALRDQIATLKNQLALGQDQSSQNLIEVAKKHEKDVDRLREELVHQRAESARVAKALQDEKSKLLQELGILGENARSLSRTLNAKEEELGRLHGLLEAQSADLSSSIATERKNQSAAYEREQEQRRNLEQAHSDKVKTLTEQNERTLAALKSSQDQGVFLQAENARLTKQLSEENKLNLQTTKHLNDQLKQAQLDLANNLAKADTEIASLRKSIEDEGRNKLSALNEARSLDAKSASLAAKVQSAEDYAATLSGSIESAFVTFSRVRDSHASGNEKDPASQLQHMIDAHRRKHDALEALEKQLQVTQV